MCLYGIVGLWYGLSVYHCVVVVVYLMFVVSAYVQAFFVLYVFVCVFVRCHHVFALLGS